MPNLFTRVNFSAASFVATILALLQLIVFATNDKAETSWQIYRALGYFVVFSFFFMRTTLLYLREGEPAKADLEKKAPPSGTPS